MKINRLLLICSASIMLLDAKTVEITQKATGKTLEVTPENVTEGEATFTVNGKSFTVSLDTLTEESVENLKAGLPAEGESVTEEKKTEETVSESEDAEAFSSFNEAVGHSLFEVSDLWDEKAEDIAGRLNWRKESKKENNSSYRLYPRADYQFLGARPYCLTLYGGADDTPERFSIVYANKGDYASTVGSGENHFKKREGAEENPEDALKDLGDAIKADEEAITKVLTEALGEHETQYYGERDDRRKVKRWDLGKQSFLLSSKREEYVHLLIVNTEDADKDGKIKFVKDSVMKERHLKNVRNEDNGDVWIDNIPMVNQGPKGYCAPATFERAMSYMNVPADMYLLATAATNPLGGTNTRVLASEAEKIVRSKARRIKPLELPDGLNVKEVKSFIDKGVPVLWQMRSLERYNKIANERTVKRENVDDFTAWAGEIQEEAEAVVPELGIEDKHHICMIIGYNEETNELAVSDSWGPRYELRWVHADIANAVTSTHTKGYIIDF